MAGNSVALSSSSVPLTVTFPTSSTVKTPAPSFAVTMKTDVVPLLSLSILTVTDPLELSKPAVAPDTPLKNTSGAPLPGNRMLPETAVTAIAFVADTLMLPAIVRSRDRNKSRQRLVLAMPRSRAASVDGAKALAKRALTVTVSLDASPRVTLPLAVRSAVKTFAASLRGTLDDSRASGSVPLVRTAALRAVIGSLPPVSCVEACAEGAPTLAACINTGWPPLSAVPCEWCATANST